MLQQWYDHDEEIKCHILDGHIFKTPCFSCSINQDTLWQPLSQPHYLQKPIKRGTMCKKRSQCLSTYKGKTCAESYLLGRRPPRGWYLITWWNAHCTCMKRLPPMWASPVSLYCLRLPLTPSSPISITFESCWAGQSWQRCCPVRAQRLRISHHPAGLSTLCHPPKMHCLKVVVVQNPFFSASSRVYFLHLALSVLESNLRWDPANLRMLARPCKVQLVPEDIPSWSAHDMSRSIPILDTQPPLIESRTRE